MRLISQLANGAGSRPATVEAKEAGGVKARIAAVRTRGDLKTLLHRDGGLSLSEASRIIAGMMREDGAPAQETEELSEAGVARAFRDLRARDAARFKFLVEAIDEHEASARAAARPLPEHKFYNGHANVTPTEYWLDDVKAEMAAELAKELKACADDGAIEAKLVRLGWPDAQINRFLDIG